MFQDLPMVPIHSFRNLWLKSRGHSKPSNASSAILSLSCLGPINQIMVLKVGQFWYISSNIISGFGVSDTISII